MTKNFFYCKPSRYTFLQVGLCLYITGSKYRGKGSSKNIYTVLFVTVYFCICTYLERALFTFFIYVYTFRYTVHIIFYKISVLFFMLHLKCFSLVAIFLCKDVYYNCSIIQLAGLFN